MEQQQKEADEEPSQKRPRTSLEIPVSSIPTFDSLENMSVQTFLEAFQKYQVVLLKGASKYLVNDESGVGNNTPRGKQRENTFITWKDIGSVFETLNKDDKESWCIENQGETKEPKKVSLTAKEFLAPRLLVEESAAYCSFLVQKDKTVYQKTLERLPVQTLGSALGDNTWTYEPCLWIFFGRNYSDYSTKIDNKEPLEGRGLHTDSVSHDGTWHYQMSGTKEWFLSPSSDLLNKHWKSELSEEERSQWKESTKVRVPCEEGDVIIVNTRLWFHRTVIPAQKHPSVSYARDFRLGNGSDNCGTGNTSGTEVGDNKATTMTNLDGLYARNEIEAGTVIFTEADMPDCELHRSSDNPNCEIVELEDGTGAVVSCRAIASGEFFCVPESSDEEEGADEYEEEEGDFEEDDVECT